MNDPLNESDEPIVESRHFIVSGIVQGVGFRAATRRKADQLLLSGWVQNAPDGDVVVSATGAVDKLEALEKWLWVGPDGAHVTEVLWATAKEGEEL